VAFDTLFRRWGLEIIVVAGNRLGALNHTLLTVRTAETAGLVVRAVIVNTMSDAPPSLAERTNVDALRRLVPGTAVLPFPYVTPSDDHRAGAWALGPLIDAVVPISPLS
jgi:dethiobiotin synthetase